MVPIKSQGERKEAKGNEEKEGKSRTLLAERTTTLHFLRCTYSRNMSAREAGTQVVKKLLNQSGIIDIIA